MSSFPINIPVPTISYSAGSSPGNVDLAAYAKLLLRLAVKYESLSNEFQLELTGGSPRDSEITFRAIHELLPNDGLIYAETRLFMNRQQQRIVYVDISGGTIELTTDLLNNQALVTQLGGKQAAIIVANAILRLRLELMTNAVHYALRYE